MNKKLKKIITTLAMTACLTGVAAISALAEQHVSIQNKYEVESNNTYETANIVPFNGTFAGWSGWINNEMDHDYFIITLKEDKALNFQITPASTQTTSNFRVVIADETIGEYYYFDSLPREKTRYDIGTIQGETGHTYSVYIDIEGEYTVPAKYILRVYGE